MIPSDVLSPVLRDGLARNISWFDAAARFDLDELITTFYDTRERSLEALDGLTDAQVTFASPVHPLWSVSETITHLIYSQGFYHNKLLDLATSELPHVIEAARGFGEGARTGVSAQELRRMLEQASEQIKSAIEATRRVHDPQRSEFNEYFGVCNYKTWILLLLGHEVDHLRQIVAMRRLARAERV